MEQVEVDGVRLRVALDGDPKLPALALINGAYSNLESFTPALPHLTKPFFVIRHDVRGTGQSDPGPRADYTFERYADDLRGILDALSVERAIVCGMAYGARTAARFALRHPTRVSLLALYDVSLAPPVDQTLQREGNERAKQLRAEAGLPEPLRSRSWFEHRDRREAGRALTAHEGRPDPTPELASFGAPTLVVCGRQDANLAEARRISQTLPNAQLEIMEMTGHGSVLSRPDLFSSLLLEFAERHAQRA